MKPNRMVKHKIRELKPDEVLILQANNDIPTSHLDALINELEKYFTSQKGPYFFALDSRFTITILNKNQLNTSNLPNP